MMSYFQSDLKDSAAFAFQIAKTHFCSLVDSILYLFRIKLVYAVLVLTVLVYTEHRLIEPRLTGARLSALAQAALV